MKKMISVLLAMSLTLSLAACSGTSPKTAQETSSAQPAAGASSTVAEVQHLEGGWERPVSPVVTEEQKTLLERATQELDGAQYAAVACLGTQVVAGTNHRLLCTVTPVVPDAVSTYAIVTLYEDLEGNAELTEVLESTEEAPQEGLAGGWTAPESPELTEEALTMFQKATEDVEGTSYSPVVLLSTQVVAGTNYRFLCEAHPGIREGETEYDILTVYEDLEGNVELTEVVSFQTE